MSERGSWGDKIIIYLKSNSERRHKTWCVYYEDGYCKHKMQKCCGSAFCESYLQKAGAGPVSEYGVPDFVPEIDVCTGTNVKREPECRNRNVVLCHYATFKERLIGKLVLIKQVDKAVIGEVVNMEGFYIVVDRDDGKISKFNRNIVIKNKALWVIDNLTDCK